MEIRRLLRGENVQLTAARPAQSGEKEKPAARPSADRLELSRQWVENMEEQRAQVQSALLTCGKEETKSNGILDMLDQSSAEEEELDALSKQLKIQQKCLKIAMNMMKGKKVPPEDEQYLMEHDPEGYKLAIAMRGAVKQEDEECESVLKDGEEGSGETGETGEAAPAAGGEAPSGGEE